MERKKSSLHSKMPCTSLMSLRLVEWRTRKQTTPTPNGYRTVMLTHVFHKQLGTYGRAKRKVEEMQKVIAESRRAH